MGEALIMDKGPGTYANALVDSLITKASVAQRVGESTDKPETVGKCVNPLTGEPVSARREETAVSPVKGSVVDSADGNGKGVCPHCATLVKLSGKGFVTAHVVRRESIPAPKTRLADRMPQATESGARVGSADASERARVAELSGHAGTGTVRVVVRAQDIEEDGTVKAKSPDPVTGTVTLVVVEGVSATDVDMGEQKSKAIEVPATVDNIRTAIRQESRKRARPERKKSTVPGEKGELTGRTTGGPDTALLARLNRMLKGATGLESVGALGAEPGCYQVREAVQVNQASVDVTGGTGSGRDERGVPVRGHKLNARVPSSPGTGLVQGGSMRPVEPPREGKNGKPRNAAGWSRPVGRPKVDPMVIAGGDTEACNGKPGRPCTVKGCVAVVGDQYGYLECHVFRALDKTAQRRYWGHVTTAKKRAQAARERTARPVVVSRHASHVTGKRVGTGEGVRMSSDA